jgi:hypothetical protein
MLYRYVFGIKNLYYKRDSHIYSKNHFTNTEINTRIKK